MHSVDRGTAICYLNDFISGLGDPWGLRCPLSIDNSDPNHHLIIELENQI